MPEDRTFLTRDEFDSFERNVSRSFDDVGQSINRLSKKIDDIGGRATDWKAIFSGLGLFATIIIAIGGLVAWGMNARQDVMATAADKHGDRWHEYRLDVDERFNDVRIYSDRNREAVDEILQREMRLLDAASTAEVLRLDELIDRQIQWANDHDQRVVGLNAAQWERIRAIERKVYGKPVPITHGAPDGASW